MEDLGTMVVLGESCNCSVLSEAPRYLPVMWQCSQIESPLRDFPPTRQSHATLWSPVLTVSSGWDGNAHTSLILCSTTAKKSMESQNSMGAPFHCTGALRGCNHSLLVGFLLRTTHERVKVGATQPMKIRSSHETTSRSPHK